MTASSGVLCLGTRPDAGVWEKECKALGFDVPLPIKQGNPGMAQLKAFFRRRYDWVFFAGHFAGSRLYNDRGDVSLTFSAESITLSAGGETAVLRKGTEDLQLSAPALVLWGGCSTLGNADTVTALHGLFGDHTMVGFQAMTGWRMVKAMLDGGGFINRPFFRRVTQNSSGSDCRDAWLATANAGYGGGGNEHRFAAVDPDGQRWIVRDRAIVRDRKLY